MNQPDFLQVGTILNICLGVQNYVHTLISFHWCLELSVADSFFISKRSSVIGFAAMINSLDDSTVTIPIMIKTRYMNTVSDALGVPYNSIEVVAAQRRLRLLAIVNGG